MIPRMEILPKKKLVGKKLFMSYAADRTFELWSSFMPLRKTIANTIGTDLYSMQIYDATFNFRQFNLNHIFEKWAGVEVTDFSAIPDIMLPHTLIGGLYAVFIHKGLPSDGPATFSYIFNTWLPRSGYEIDHREHFEILGRKYKNNDPASEEEIWIPVKILGT